MEKIIKIEEVYDIDGETKTQLTPNEYGYCWDGMDGFKITTDKQEIFCLIDNSQSCCEAWGYLTSEDDLKQYEGAVLKKVEIVDTALNKEAWDREFQYGLDAGDAMFVDFITDRGTFQIAVYNAHNGYYGHSVLLSSEQVKYATRL